MFYIIVDTPFPSQIYLLKQEICNNICFSIGNTDDSRHGLILGVPKSVPAHTDFEKFVLIFPDSTVECQFYS